MLGFADVDNNGFKDILYQSGTTSSQEVQIYNGSSSVLRTIPRTARAQRVSTVPGRAVRM